MIQRGNMPNKGFLPVLLASTIASVSAASAQALVIEEPLAPPAVVAAPAPVLVPATPGVVVVHRPAPVIVRSAPLIAREPIVVAPAACPYGYGYC